MENDIQYWRNRCSFYERQTANLEERIEDMEEMSAQKSAIIASLRARLKELEERCHPISSS